MLGRLIFKAGSNETKAVLFNYSEAVEKINNWARQVDVEGRPYVYSYRKYNDDFRLDIRRVGKFGFPPYYRIFIIDHLFSNSSFQWNAKTKTSLIYNRDESNP